MTPLGIMKASRTIDDFATLPIIITAAPPIAAIVPDEVLHDRQRATASVVKSVRHRYVAYRMKHLCTLMRCTHPFSAAFRATSGRAASLPPPSSSHPLSTSNGPRTSSCSKSPRSTSWTTPGCGILRRTPAKHQMDCLSASREGRRGWLFVFSRVTTSICLTFVAALKCQEMQRRTVDAATEGAAERASDVFFSTVARKNRSKPNQRPSTIAFFWQRQTASSARPSV